MKSVYMAIWYACNQFCSGCPCSKNVDKSKNMTLEDVKRITEKALSGGESVSVTLSGGEPTLHPEFLEILKYFRSKDVFVTILTNSERFSDKAFADAFLESTAILRTRVVTTFHSSKSEIHEAQNGSKGSFQRSLAGLKYIFNKGIGVTVKHCITKVNMEDTADFIKFVDSEFHPMVDIQLFGFDYCGLSKEEAQKLYCHFSIMKPFIENALDEAILIHGKNGRNLRIYNIPLCWLDPYYWNLCCLNDDKNVYGIYSDPGMTDENFGDGSGKYSEKCKSCYVNEICPGTYKSMFEYFGDSAVSGIEDRN